MELGPHTWPPAMTPAEAEAEAEAPPNLTKHSKKNTQCVGGCLLACH